MCNTKYTPYHQSIIHLRPDAAVQSLVDMRHGALSAETSIRWCVASDSIAIRIQWDDGELSMESATDLRFFPRHRLSREDRERVSSVASDLGVAAVASFLDMALETTIVVTSDESGVLQCTVGEIRELLRIDSAAARVVA